MAEFVEFDPVKAASNKRKHGVSFDEAQTVFGDPQAIDVADEAHSGPEERFVRLGLSGLGRLLVVVYAEWEDGGDLFRRIISARGATRREARAYVTER